MTSDSHPLPPSAATQLVATLADEGVRHLFINPGTDTAPVQEALAAARADGLPHPRAVLCTHEFVALSAAMGHYFVTGEPQAVMVHVDAGTLNLGGAVHNAQRNRLPVVIFAGRTPYSLSPEVPGHRDTSIHWPQEQLDQQGIVRSYMRWSMEVPRGRDLGTIVRRAYQVARSSPGGPSYVMLPREALMEPGVDPAPPRLVTPRPPAPDPAGLAEAARLLADARRPVIITDRTGATPEAVHALVRIAELIGAPVVDHRHRHNFPPRHALYAGAHDAVLRDADAVLLLDTEVPWVPALAAPPADAKVVQIDADCVKATMPTWSYPVHVALTADTASALPILESALLTLADGRAERWAARRISATAELAPVHQDWERAGTSPEPDDAVDAMLYALNAALPEDAIVLEEAVTNKPAVSRQLVRAPGMHFDTGSPALGWGVAGALGVKLGAPAAPVVTIVGDGSFNFGVPNAALWSAHRAGAPFITVILNNQAYRASRLPVEKLFPDGSAAKHTDFPETELSPPPDYARLAEALGAHGETVRRPEDMAAALTRALKSQSEGRCAVLDAHLPPP